MEKSTLEELYFGSKKLNVNSMNVSLDDLKPYFSVRIYKIDLPWNKLENNSKKATWLKNRLDEVQWPDGVRSYFWQSDTRNLLALITVLQEEPPWADGAGIQNIQFDLHLFYYPSNNTQLSKKTPKMNNLLFELTTSEKIAHRLHDAIAGDNAKDISSQKIMNLLNFGGNFRTVGLKNVTKRGPAQPDYKTLAGPRVQTAVLPSDRMIFMMGHALRKLPKETRGVGTLHSKVWATRRDTVKEFMDWCDNLAIALNAKSIPGGPLSLAISETIDTLEERPLAVYLDYSFMGAKLTIEIKKKVYVGDITPTIEIKYFNKTKGTLLCEFCFGSQENNVSLFYSANAEKPWKQIDGHDLRVKLEFPDGKEFKGTLEWYLKRYPPSLVMPSGGIVVKNERWKPSQSPGPLADSCLNPLVWTGCHRKCEAGKIEGGLMNIQDWVAQQLEDPVHIEREPISEDALIIRDHGSGEMADIIVIEPIGEGKCIEFYHCKAMKGNAPGVRVTDSYEVLGQACRNGQWILSPVLMEELYRRTQPPRESPILKGSEKTLKVLSDKFMCNEWRYRVVAVQPGFDCEKIKKRETKKSKKVYPLFVSTYEWLSACGAEFAVWGS